MLIAVSALASVLAVFWLALLFMVTNEDWVTAATCRVVDNQRKITQLRQKDRENAKKLSQYTGLELSIMKLFISADSSKEIAKLERECRELQSGNLKSVALFDMSGYVLQRMAPGIGNGDIFRTVLEKSTELYGRKYAKYKARQLLARLISYPIIGVAASLALGCIFFAAGKTTPGLIVMGGFSLIIIVVVYAMYDDLSDKVNKRRAAISRQFPNVVSKLALLVTSGMIMDRAWRETAESSELELYQEMRKTSEELANMVAPATAYSNFIDRCNTKETTKLASAIIQSLSKGNAEVGALLKSMAHEAWQERRHSAKRASEAANSRLMIPTMLLFMAILIMIMVPVMSSFGSL